jgi:hypothetical protein
VIAVSGNQVIKRTCRGGTTGRSLRPRTP